MAYTDLFNEAIDDLTATLTAVSGLRVVNDPTKLAPNCVYLDAPNFTTTFGNGNIVRLEFPIKVIGSGPAGLSRPCSTSAGVPQGISRSARSRSNRSKKASSLGW